jgi:hypothetical protein
MMTNKMEYGYLFLHLGELRAPLFAKWRAPWEKVGPLVKRIIDGDVASHNCGLCDQPVQGQDESTAFLVELGYDGDGKWVNVSGWACCQSCSRLSKNEMYKRFWADVDAYYTAAKHDRDPAGSC